MATQAQKPCISLSIQAIWELHALSSSIHPWQNSGLLDQWLIEGKFTKEEALSISYDMLSAGINTVSMDDMLIIIIACNLQTSNSATFLLYELAKQPELQERLVQEISSVVGDKEHPSWEDLQKMTLVRNCVKETMRLYSPTGSLHCSWRYCASWLQSPSWGKFHSGSRMLQ